MADTSPRDRYLVVFGRKPVMEAFQAGLPVARVHLADNAQGPAVEAIVSAARRRGVTVERVTPQRVAAIARDGRQHQGVAADVEVPAMSSLEAFVEHRRGRRHDTRVLVLDRVHNPSNVGMILRTAVAAGLDGVVVPRAGTADIGPIAIKASAGVAFRAPVLWSDTTDTALELLASARFELVGLDATGVDLFGAELSSRLALVLGNETDGLSPSSRVACHRLVSIPLEGGVESLNVAAAAAVVAYELRRRS